MNNELNNVLFRKYFSREEWEKVLVEARNLVSDLMYFEEYIYRHKKSSFNFKLSPVANFPQKSLDLFFNDWRMIGLAEDSIYQALIRYNLCKFFILGLYEDTLPKDSKSDLIEFSNGISSLYENKGLLEFISDFIECSHGISSTREKLTKILESH